jgi:hypothetical protein
MDVDVDSVETELNAYMRFQQVPLDTDPLMWWKQHVQDFPRLSRIVRQHLTVPDTSASPERLFSSVGLIKSDLRVRFLDTTLIHVMSVKQAPWTHLNQVSCVYTPWQGGQQEHTLSGKLDCLCACEDRASSPTLTVFVNFQTLSNIINRPSSVNSWLIATMVLSTVGW